MCVCLCVHFNDKLQSIGSLFVSMYVPSSCCNSVSGQPGTLFGTATKSPQLRNVPRQSLLSISNVHTLTLFDWAIAFGAQRQATMNGCYDDGRPNPEQKRKCHLINTPKQPESFQLYLRRHYLRFHLNLLVFRVARSIPVDPPLSSLSCALSVSIYFEHIFHELAERSENELNVFITRCRLFRLRIAQILNEIDSTSCASLMAGNSSNSVNGSE